MNSLNDLRKEKESLREAVAKLLFDFREKFPEISRVDLRAESYGNLYDHDKETGYTCKSNTTIVTADIKI